MEYGILPFFLKPNTISLRDYQLMLCVPKYCLELQGEIRKLMPKGRSACNNICLGISLLISRCH